MPVTATTKKKRVKITKTVEDYVMKDVDVYICSDGKEFEKLSDANDHEYRQTLRTIKPLQSLYSIISDIDYPEEWVYIKNIDDIVNVCRRFRLKESDFKVENWYLISVIPNNYGRDWFEAHEESYVKQLLIDALKSLPSRTPDVINIENTLDNIALKFPERMNNWIKSKGYIPTSVF
ncbi:MAG: hypothetical protein AMQ22_00594 [Candidatus Methanofastidiosum methylothiophilum]|uniref:Uncharacterized protein n=1 Tax=Candidatus Methanofastidiosum methylothiophilum TaxID=1705564 RepID=A0A150J6D6_9EURY|nr:MAG: hypothetical protein AMQ22_00594 [Candidatus Methanofastidiosum methylthiophilus]